MITIKTSEEIKIMAEGGKILAQIIQKLAQAVRPGIATRKLDKLARELVSYYRVEPAFLGYGGFPATVCISVNDEVVHGVPSSRILNEGDIVGLDMGIIYEGLNVDSAVTLPALADLTYKDWTRANPREAKLIEVTKTALEIGISQARVGNHVGAIGHAVQKFVEGQGFSVVRDLVGHGIGRKLHEEPAVPNFGRPTDGPELVEGMVIAIEPMVTEGDWRVKKGSNGFVFVTADGSWAAHFEHTILVTRKNPEILSIA